MRGWEAGSGQSSPPGIAQLNCCNGLGFQGQPCRLLPRARPPGCPEHLGCGDSGCRHGERPVSLGPAPCSLWLGGEGQESGLWGSSGLGLTILISGQSKMRPPAPRKHGRPRPTPDDHGPWLPLHSPGPAGLLNPLPALCSPALFHPVDPGAGVGS